MSTPHTSTTNKLERTLLIANGEPPSKALVNELLKHSATVYCVDGGADIACRYQLSPAAVFGDFDSVSVRARTTLSCEFRLTEDQEFQDLDKALSCLIAEGKKSISLVGALGGRADHSYANLGPLLKYRQQAGLTVHGRYEDLFIIDGEWSGDLTNGRRVSILPMFGPSRVLTANLQYPLHNEILQLGVRDGISNRSLGGKVTIHAAENPVLLSIARPRPSQIVFAPDIL